MTNRWPAAVAIAAIWAAVAVVGAVEPAAGVIIAFFAMFPSMLLIMSLD